MSKYFNYFPKVQYSLEDKIVNLNVVTNILFRYAFTEELKNNDAAYYTYTIKDGEKPEDIAYRVYGSPERHWMILTFNDIIDPLSDWPMDQRTFKAYLDDKYESEGANNIPQLGGYEWAQANTHSYKIIDTVTDLQTDTITTEVYYVDVNTYANISATTVTKTLENGDQITIDTSKQEVSYFDYENEINENKRYIKILKKEAVKSVEQEFKRLAESS